MASSGKAVPLMWRGYALPRSHLRQSEAGHRHGCDPQLVWATHMLCAQRRSQRFNAGPHPSYPLHHPL